MMKLSTLFLSVLTLGACQHSVEPVPAVLADGSAETLEAVKTEMAEALGKASVTLGAGDLTKSSILVIAPPPLGPHETRSTAAPIRYDLQMHGEICYAVREETDEMIELTNVPCRAL